MRNRKKRPLFSVETFRSEMFDALNSDLAVGNPSAEQHFFTKACHEKFLSKFLSVSSPVELRNKAYAKFLKVNVEMRKFNLNLDSKMGHVHRFARNVIFHVLGPHVPWDEVFLFCKNSKGASVGVPRQDTSNERKFTFPISCTEDVVPLWLDYLEFDPVLDHSLRVLNSATDGRQLHVITKGSRACTVPKDNRGDRMIAVEPVINMFFQHGLAHVMEEGLRRIGLSVTSDPEKHIYLAYRGSIDNSYATIDFSSMSDRVSLGLCRFLLPEEWYKALCTVRCDSMSIEGYSLPLHMISTMGNSTTFPLQTLVLWSLAYAVQQISLGRVFPDLRDLFSRKSDIHVFGDDCILRQDLALSFLKACIDSGFVPNDDKSYFKDEFFRESCGGDFFHGRDVRPLYLRSLPSLTDRRQLEAHLYTLFNEALKKYIKYFGPLNYVYEKRLFMTIFRYLRLIGADFHVVPFDFPDDSGLKIWEDFYRFRRSYSLNARRPSQRRFGFISFSYLSYNYPNGRLSDDTLRYAIDLKRLSRGDLVYLDRTRFTGIFSKVRKKPKWDIEERKGGFYVRSNCKTSLYTWVDPITGTGERIEPLLRCLSIKKAC